MSKESKEEFKTKVKNKLEKKFGGNLDFAINQFQKISIEILATEEFLRDKKLNIKFERSIKRKDESILDLVEEVAADDDRKMRILENLGLSEDKTEIIVPTVDRRISWRLDDQSKKYRLFYVERPCRVAAYYNLEHDKFFFKKYFEGDSIEEARVLHDCPLEIRMELFSMLPYFISDYSNFINRIFERQRSDELLCSANIWSPFE